MSSRQAKPDEPLADAVVSEGAADDQNLPRPFEPREGVPAPLTTANEVKAYAAALARGTGPCAIDAERASGFRYGNRAYLVQIRRAGAGTALIDPIDLADLAPIHEALSGVEWILHAATQDLPCLAELGMVPDQLFDTELAGRLLGRERVNLSALVFSELGEVLEKGHGAADWSARPLSDAMLRYAALDVELLVELRDSLESSLREAGKWQIAEQEFTHLLSFAPKDRGDQAWRRTSGIHRIRAPRDLACVRELWLTRDSIAAKSDVAPGRILPDSAIIAATAGKPASREALMSTSGFHGRGAARYQRQWWEAIERSRGLPQDELPVQQSATVGPPPPKAWAERNPEAWARLCSARSGLADVAEGLHLPVENLVAPDVIRRLCWEPPDASSPQEVEAILIEEGARPWQAHATSHVLLAAFVTD